MDANILYPIACYYNLKASLFEEMVNSLFAFWLIKQVYDNRVELLLNIPIDSGIVIIYVILLETDEGLSRYSCLRWIQQVYSTMGR